MFVEPAPAEPSGRPLRLAAVVALSVYDALWVVVVLVLSAIDPGSSLPPADPLLRAEAGALARVQAALAQHVPQAAEWMDGPIEEALDGLPEPAPERLIWLGETERRERLARELPGSASEGLGSALRRLYLGAAPGGPETARADRDALAAIRTGYFRQAALARSGDAAAARELEQSSRQGLRLLLLAGGGLLAAALAGLGLLTTAWLWLPRLHLRTRFPAPDPGPFAPLDVVLAFVAWLAFYFSLSLAVGGLEVARRHVMASLVLTYLVQGLGGWILLHRILAPRSTARELFRSLVRGAGRPGLVRCLSFGLAGFAVAVPIVYVTGWLVHLVGGPAPVSENPLIPVLLQSRSVSDRLLVLLTVTILAPVFEELLFRGVLLPALRRPLGPALAIGFSGLLFAAIHLDAHALIPLTALGSVLGYVAHRGGSLVPAMVTHGLWNAQAFVQIELLRRLA
jgi:hypothetical protein